MNDTRTPLDARTFDDWCDLVEYALTEDSEESWQQAALDPPVRATLPLDTEEALRHAERIAQLVGRVEARRLLARDELDGLADERRHLVTHSRAVTSYRMTESPEPIERLLRMMWVG